MIEFEKGNEEEKEDLSTEDHVKEAFQKLMQERENSPNVTLASGDQSWWHGFGQIAAGVAAVVVPVVAIVVAMLNGWIGTINRTIESLDNRIAEMDTRLLEVQLTVGRMADYRGIIPSPQSSVLWIALDMMNFPFSGLSKQDEIWEGVFPEFADNWGKEIGFPEIQYLPLSSVEDIFSVAEFDYFATILNEDDAVAKALVSQGWTPIPLDGYFSDAGYGPYEYSLFVSSRSVQAGALPLLSSALDRLELRYWEDWGIEIDEGYP